MQSPSDPYSVRGPSGQPCRFATMLNRFAATRLNRSQAFFFGHWLESLDEAAFAEISAITDEQDMPDGPESAAIIEDMAMVTLTAYRREMAPRTAKYPDAKKFAAMMDAMQLAIANESLRRAGFIELATPLSVLPNRKLSMRLTDYAIETLGLDGTEESKQRAMEMLRTSGGRQGLMDD